MSAILSEPLDQSPMAFPDYTQVKEFNTIQLVPKHLFWLVLFLLKLDPIRFTFLFEEKEKTCFSWYRFQILFSDHKILKNKLRQQHD